MVREREMEKFLIDETEQVGQAKLGWKSRHTIFRASKLCDHLKRLFIRIQARLCENALRPRDSVKVSLSLSFTYRLHSKRIGLMLRRYL